MNKRLRPRRNDPRPRPRPRSRRPTLHERHFAGPRIIRRRALCRPRIRKRFRMPSKPNQTDDQTRNGEIHHHPRLAIERVAVDPPHFCGLGRCEGGDAVGGLQEGGELRGGEDRREVGADGAGEDDLGDGEADDAAEDSGLGYGAHGYGCLRAFVSPGRGGHVMLEEEKKRGEWVPRSASSTSTLDTITKLLKPNPKPRPKMT